MKNSDLQSKKIRKRSIYFLPNLLTTGSLFFGFYAIISAMNHEFTHGAIAIFIAMLLDGLDGRVARLINAQSAFGAEYDSLSDLVSFGMAPALLIYNWSLNTLDHQLLHKVGWLCAFLYVACVALRLAKFNIQIDEDDIRPKKYFYGLPCPSAAALVASLVWTGSLYHLHNLTISIMSAIIVIAVAVLMVSNIRYQSFKHIDLKDRIGFAVLVVIVMLLICIAFLPAHMLLLIFATYIISGPTVALNRFLKKRRHLSQRRKTHG